MFNHIRKVPYVAGDGRGGISYFAGGFSNQFGMETQIIAAICEFPLELKLGPRNRIVLTTPGSYRWDIVFCNNRSGIESSTHGGC
jgi:hypothetical protein